jgi:hypothetical protein
MSGGMLGGWRDGGMAVSCKTGCGVDWVMTAIHPTYYFQSYLHWEIQIIHNVYRREIIMTLSSGLKKILVLFVTIFALLACQVTTQQPTRNIRITEVNSPLLDVLMKEADPSDTWELSAMDIDQTPITPSEENGSLIEEAKITLAGDYGTQEYYINITHILSKYQDVSPGIQPGDIHLSRGTPFYPKFPSLGLEMQSNCYRVSSTSVCFILVDYGLVISEIGIYAPSAMTDQEIEVMLNQVLENIDARVRDQLLSK